jgi:hypothetical protein
MTKTFGILNFCHLNLFRISKFDIRIYHVLLLLCSCALAYVTGGCEKTNTKEPVLTKQVYLLEQEKTQLIRQVGKSEAEKEQLKKQIQVLSDLESQLEDIYNLQRIKIAKYTNIYDEDKNGKAESLIVYVQPLDANGDVIKAGGAVDVQLWDLNKAGGEALLGQWRVEPDELKKHWVAFLVINYRLKFDVTNIVDKFEEPLTVKVTFTDYLSGKVFKEQKVIKPRTSP